MFDYHSKDHAGQELTSSHFENTVLGEKTQ